VATNARRDAQYAQATGGWVGLAGFAATVAFGLMSLHDAFKSASALHSVLTMVGRVIAWPGAAAWRLGKRLLDVAMPPQRLEDAELVIRVSRAIMNGESVTKSDYESAVAANAVIAAHVGRRNPAIRVGAMLAGSVMYGAGTILQAAGAAARVISEPVAALHRAKTTSAAIVWAGNLFGASESASGGFMAKIAYLGSPDFSLTEAALYLRDCTIPTVSTVLTYAAQHAHQIAGAAAVTAATGIGIALLLRHTHMGSRIAGALRATQYLWYGGKTVFRLCAVLPGALTLYDVGAKIAGYPVGIAFVTLYVASQAYGFYRDAVKVLRLRRKTAVGEGGDVGGEVALGTDAEGDPVTAEDCANMLIACSAAGKGELEFVASELKANHDLIIAEEILRQAKSATPDVLEAGDAGVMNKMRRELRV
jgi:hypothetical protein